MRGGREVRDHTKEGHQLLERILQGCHLLTHQAIALVSKFLPMGLLLLGLKLSQGSSDALELAQQQEEEL